jgi:hypothetical protein
MNLGALPREDASVSMRRTLLIIGLAGGMTFQIPAAQAQGGALASCAKFVWQYVGKPLTGAMIDRGAGLVADYFYDKLRTGSGGGVISQQDITALQRRGVSECEIRQQLEAMYAGQQTPYARPYAPRPRPAQASMCHTQWGTCFLAEPLPVQSQCVCPSAYGWVPGFAR